MKATHRWFSDLLEMEMTLARWGHEGVPVLLFPTAGGHAEEAEDRGLIDACSHLLEAGRVKLYACDSVAGKAMVEKWGEPQQRQRLLNGYHLAVRNEVVPAIHEDCQGELDIIASGSSIGAFNALAVVCRFPDVFRSAICMSGTYDLRKHYDHEFSEEFYYSSPLDFVPGLEGERLERLRQRFVLFASGEGDWEDIGESWRAADVLGRKGIPNRVISWGEDWKHDWETWLKMLPTYLDEFTSSDG